MDENALAEALDRILGPNGLDDLVRIVIDRAMRGDQHCVETLMRYMPKPPVKGISWAEPIEK